MSDETRLVLVGQVAGAFGVRGEVRVTAFTQSPEALLSYSPLLDDQGRPALTLVSGRPDKGAIVGRAREISTREQAQAMRGLRLFIPRDRLPEPEEDEFYLTDLIGLAVVSPGGEAIGRIRSVQNFGAGDLLEITDIRDVVARREFYRRTSAISDDIVSVADRIWYSRVKES